MSHEINRRNLVISTGSLLLAAVVRRTIAAGDVGGGAEPPAASGAGNIPPAPVARVAVVKDTYFGETLSDPYRWMENDKDPDWLPFLKGQNEHTRAVLNTIPGRDK